MTIFQFQSYKEYLGHMVRLEKMRKVGAKSRLAKEAGCQPAYFSQVIKGGAHFNMEQTERLARYFGLTENETFYFLTLVQFARAGSSGVKTVFRRQLSILKEGAENLKNRLEYSGSLTDKEQARYYCHWLYAAIHILLSVPQFQSPEALANRLSVPLGDVRKAIEFLMKIGIIREKEGKLVVKETSLHLGDDSPFLRMHHINWRLKAIKSAEYPQSEKLHYSSLISVSNEDAGRIRLLLVETIEKIRSIVKTSTDQDGFCYSLDFFPL